jgi:hypothetical protein
MSYIEGESREQRILFHEVLDDYISEDNVVRFHRRVCGWT